MTAQNQVAGEGGAPAAAGPAQGSSGPAPAAVAGSNVPSGTTLADQFAADLAAIQALNLANTGIVNGPVSMPIQKATSNTWLIFVVIAVGIGGWIWYKSKHKG
jgi:hypothetical protein